MATGASILDVLHETAAAHCVAVGRYGAARRTSTLKMVLWVMGPC